MLKKQIAIIICLSFLFAPNLMARWDVEGGSGTPEGTAILSTGEGGGTKYLREDGDGTCSWQTPAGSSPVTTKGDIYTYSTVDARLPVGANGAMIAADSAEATGVKWITQLNLQFGQYLEAEGATDNASEKTIDFGDPDADYGIDATGNFDMQIPADSAIDANGLVLKAGLATDAKFYSIPVATLSDSTTPSVLTTAESTNTCVSNYKASGADHVFTLPAAHAAGNIIFIIGDEFQVDIEPDTGANFFLNGTAMAANEHIQNTADTLGENIVGYCANINGTLTWMFESKYTNFVEETP